ncbi:t-SNARE family protein 5 [Acrasis kona]|uniref:t-SNARE family protein 5 n=1 Tax=Acrasis kona TaxID=1008807 RepID=A0AAW2Z8Q0_9EUKA
MAFLDRTDEFNSLIQNKVQKKSFDGGAVKKRQPIVAANSKEASKKFYSEASQVSQGLQNTADILQKLTKLVKKRTPFNDNSDHIQHLTLMVKEQLATHGHTLNSLSGLIEQQKNNVYQKTEQSTQHTSHILTGLNSRLLYATQEFQKVLITRTKQKETERSRQSKFAYDSKPQSTRAVIKPPPSPMTPQNTVINMSHLEEQNQPNNGAQLLEYAPNRLTDVNDRMIQKRTDEVLQIEQDISNLGSMMGHLAVMIKQQGELMNRIDSNVMQARENVDLGQNQLMKYWRNIQGNQGLVLKMFFVLIVFIIFVAVFVIK